MTIGASMQVRVAGRAAAAALALSLAATCAASQAVAAGGIQWRIGKVISRPFAIVGLNQVTAVSQANMWAAGGLTPFSGADQPVLEHWNGHQWTNRTPPVVALHLADSDLTAIGSSSRTNVWVLGTSSGQSYALRWDGLRWRKFSFRKAIDMTAVLVFSPTDVWAFGRPIGRTARPFAEHFGGRFWHATSLPGFANSVSAVNARDIWAVGPQPGAGSGQLVLSHWAGTSWHAIPLPSVGPPGYVLTHPGVLAVSDTEVWVDAEVTALGGAKPLHPVLLSFNGSTWQWHRCPLTATRLGQMATTGSGVWLAAGAGPPFPGYFVHYGSGRWTWQQAKRPSTALDSMVFALVQVPGSPFLLAAGNVLYHLGGSGVIYDFTR
jgi:hypothetical protein